MHSMDERFGAPVSSEWAAFVGLLRLVQAKVEFMLTVDINNGESDTVKHSLSVGRPTTVPHMGEAIEVKLNEELVQVKKGEVVQV